MGSLDRLTFDLGTLHLLIDTKHHGLYHCDCIIVAMWPESDLSSGPAAQHWTMEWDNTQLHFDLTDCFHHQVGHVSYVLM